MLSSEPYSGDGQFSNNSSHKNLLATLNLKGSPQNQLGFGGYEPKSRTSSLKKLYPISRNDTILEELDSGSK
jgi:hypothetical protein